MALSRITNYIEADGADLNLQSSDTTITASSVLGVINFKAPSEASGTDAILLASKIEAVAEGTFSASSNATKLSFATASSEAASEKMSLSSAGLLTVSGRIITDDTTEATSTTDGSLQTDGGLSVAKDIIAGDDVKLLSDDAVLSFGANSEITVTHHHDNGLKFKNTNTADGSQMGIVLQTGETDIVQDDVLGRIQFQAPDEAGGTDAILIAAEISATAQATFAADNNKTKLSFKTANSEAATEKVTIDGNGHVQILSGSLTVDTVGQVFGVGTNNPGHTIEAKATAPEILLEETNSGGSKRISMGVTDAGVPFINAEQSGGQVRFNMAGTLLGRFHEYGLAVGRGVEISTSGPFMVFAPSATHNQNDPIVHLNKDTNVGNDRFIRARQNHTSSSAIRGNIRVNSGQNNLEFESSSDRRIKQDIADLTGAIDKIKELKPRTFKFKEDPSRGTFVGFIAQELYDIFPTWVTKTDDGTGDTVPTEKNELDKDEDQPWTIGTDALQFYLVGALKEAITKIETLETSNADLITRVKALEDA